MSDSLNNRIHIFDDPILEKPLAKRGDILIDEQESFNMVYGTPRSNNSEFEEEKVPQ